MTKPCSKNGSFQSWISECFHTWFHELRGATRACQSRGVSGIRLQGLWPWQPAGCNVPSLLAPLVGPEMASSPAPFFDPGLAVCVFGSFGALKVTQFFYKVWTAEPLLLSKLYAGAVQWLSASCTRGFSLQLSVGNRVFSSGLWVNFMVPAILAHCWLAELRRYARSRQLSEWRGLIAGRQPVATASSAFCRLPLHMLLMAGLIHCNTGSDKVSQNGRVRVCVSRNAALMYHVLEQIE